MSEAPLLVCCRIGAAPKRVSGSKTTLCTLCRSPVWVAPSAQRVLFEVTVVCSECAVPILQTHGDDLELHILPGQMAELRQMIRELQ